MSGRTLGALAPRLVVLGMVAILVINGVGGWLLRWQLHNAILRSAYGMVDERAERIAAGLLARPDGRIVLDSRLVHEEFRIIFSGWYWQLAGKDGMERSRSLWDSTLALDHARVVDGRHALYQLTGPRGELLFGVHRQVWLDGKAFVLHVYGPGQTIHLELLRVDRILLTMLLGLSVALSLAMLLQVRLGLRPLRQLHAALKRIHDGEGERVGSGYGTDLDPLAREIDEVLDRNTRIVSRARGHAADLSHALKKPLALLAAEGSGRLVNGALVQRQVGQMYQLIERHLARAGSGAGDLRRIDVGECLRGLVALMRKLHAARQLDWQLMMPEQAFWRGEKTDLEEMLGNVLDNAGKWASRCVQIEVRKSVDLSPDRKSAHGRMLEILVSDDGAGLSETEMVRARRRGQRFDEGTEGSGLGLPIACDIAETYGGQIELGRSSLGGLQVRLNLPC